MGSPIELLGDARAFARDFPRDRMPRQYLWDVVDFVPLVVDAPLTGRGAWRWGSDVSSADYESGILATFLAGDQLLVQNTAGRIDQVALSPPYGITVRGTHGRSVQNPVQLGDTVIHPVGNAPPSLWRSDLLTAANASHKNSKVAVTFKSMMVTGNAPGEEDAIRFSVPGKDLTAADSFEANSFYRTGRTVTALAALRAVVLIFHAGSVERMRGSIPAHGTDPGDMFIENLFDRAGCLDPRTIAYWNDNCIFADEHGVHITDGAVIRNLVSQGGILYYWRNLFGDKLTLAACTFLDYYILTIRRSVGLSPITLVCDLNRRQWFRLSNLDALTYIASGGSAGMERIWGGLAGTSRLARVGPCFFPTFDAGAIIDDNGVTVMPALETPWYTLAIEGRKRVRFVYLSYDARIPPVLRADDQPAEWRHRVLREEVESGAPPPPPPDVVRALSPVLDVGYIRSPQQPAYTSIGTLPATEDYARYRLPVNQFPYGVAFRIQQTAATTALRVFRLGVEAQAAERSRV